MRRWSPTVATWCAGADRLIVDLRVGGGSLEDVYLELVGSRREEGRLSRPASAAGRDCSSGPHGAAPDRPARRERAGHDRHPGRRPALLRLGQRPADRRGRAGRLPVAGCACPGDHRDEPGQPWHRDGVRTELRRPQAARRLATDAHGPPRRQGGDGPDRGGGAGRPAHRHRGRRPRLATRARRLARRIRRRGCCSARSRSRASACCWRARCEPRRRWPWRTGCSSASCCSAGSSCRSRTCRDRWPRWRTSCPAAALADAFRVALGSGDGDLGRSIAVLAIWGVAAVALAVRTFRWE